MNNILRNGSLIALGAYWLLSFVAAALTQSWFEFFATIFFPLYPILTGAFLFLKGTDTGIISSLWVWIPFLILMFVNEE